MRYLLAVAMLCLGLTQPAVAQDAICEGNSLVDDFQHQMPELYEEALEEFEAIPNSVGLFWRIEKPGLEPSWLLGTMHVPDPRITTLRQPVADALAESDTLVVESVDVVDPEATAEFAEEILALARLPGGETFDETFTEEQKDALGALTAAHGVPYFMARRMQPWFLSVLLSLPPCVGVGGMQGQPILDQKLFLEAREGGKEIVGLETLDEQLEALAALGGAIDESALLEIIEIGTEGIEDIYATMVGLYVEERIALLIPLFDRVPRYAATASAMGDIEGSLVIDRNHRMHERLLPVLEDGGVFVGVGALHLSGETGLIELLRESGYAVSRVE
jgi:uncharacterized protein YbaP (TraB family)